MAGCKPRYPANYVCFNLLRNNIWNFVVYLAVLEVGDGVFEVLSTSGDTHLGGDDFDKVRLCIIATHL